MHSSELPNSQQTSASWVQIVKLKRDEQIQRIPTFESTNSLWTEIIEINDIQLLASKIASGEFTAVDVASAYMQRAVAVHEKTKCLTEILWKDAISCAQELDDYLLKHGTTVGPLHGIPMTLKDQFNVKGYDTTLGYVGRAFQPAETDALLVKTLRELGVVFLAKTNLPQSIMWCETENPLWGTTTNPRDANLTPGGSTGGEGVLLAEHGSLLGWGTDIGGSVRIPAHMMGVYALKPSSGRLPYLGVPVSTEGQEHVPSVVGPMARSLSSIELVIRHIISSRPWINDPTCHALPWQQEMYQEVQSRPLTIGLMINDNNVRCHPSIERIVKKAAQKLQEAGHIIVPWSAEGHTECIEIMDAYYTADGGEDIKRSISSGGEPYVPHVEALVNRAPAISVYQYWQLNKRKRAAQAAYLKRWRESGIDILLTSVMPHPSIPHGKCKWVGYTKVWNLLDFTALVIPGGTVERSDDREDGYTPMNETDENNWELYDPVRMEGLPVGLQIVGRRLEEEWVLGAGRVVEKALWG